MIDLMHEMMRVSQEIQLAKRRLENIADSLSNGDGSTDDIDEFEQASEALRSILDMLSDAMARHKEQA